MFRPRWTNSSSPASRRSPATSSSRRAWPKAKRKWSAACAKSSPSANSPAAASWCLAKFCASTFWSRCSTRLQNRSRQAHRHRPHGRPNLRPHPRPLQHAAAEVARAPVRLSCGTPGPHHAYRLHSLFRAHCWQRPVIVSHDPSAAHHFVAVVEHSRLSRRHRALRLVERRHAPRPRPRAPAWPMPARAGAGSSPAPASAPSAPQC